MHTNNRFDATNRALLLVTTSICGMSADFDSTGAFSLADLSDLDVSEVEEIRFETLAAGVYGLEIKSASLDETTNRDQEQRFVVEMKFEVVEVKAVVTKGVDPESLVGKQHTEKFYIVPEKAPEGIGRIRAALADMGLNSKGKLGEIVEAAVGHTFYGKIINQADKDDKSRIYARLKLEAKK